MDSFFGGLIRLFLAQPVAQGVGLLALLIGISAFIQRSDQRLRLWLTLYQVAIGIHFWMMGAGAAALSAWLSSGRTLLSSRTRNLWIMTAFLLLVWGVGVPKVTMAIQWLPLIGTTLGTWGLFRERGIRMRLYMLSGTVCWVAHNFAIGSIGGTLIEASFLFVNSHTIFRLWRHTESVPAAQNGNG